MVVWQEGKVRSDRRGEAAGGGGVWDGGQERSVDLGLARDRVGREERGNDGKGGCVRGRARGGVRGTPTPARPEN